MHAKRAQKRGPIANTLRIPSQNIHALGRANTIMQRHLKGRLDEWKYVMPMLMPGEWKCWKLSKGGVLKEVESDGEEGENLLP